MKTGPGSPDLFDEAPLRRALRLDANEVPPRLDAQAIASLARARPPFGPAAFASAIVAGVAAAVLLVSGTIAIAALAPTLVGEGLAAGIGVATQIAVPVDALVVQLQEPTVPLAAIAGLAIAIAYEYRQRRERIHVLHST